MIKRDNKGRFVKNGGSPRRGIFKIRKCLICVICGKKYYTYHTESYSCSLKCRTKRFKFWEGDRLLYRKLHSMVDKERGQPNKCESCLIVTKCEWANITGNYYDPYDYMRLCKTCHKIIDRERRIINGFYR